MMTTHDQSRLVVISGGPGAGKTTLLDELFRRGYLCVPEDARRIIEEQIELRGNALPWGDRESYARLMLDRSIESFKAHSENTDLTFFDHGIPDTLAYVNMAQLGISQDANLACRAYRYASKVFFAPPWEAIYTTDNARKQTFEEAVATYRILVETYDGCGYECIEIPRVSASLRADFILRALA